jgi:hypothetical protein
VTGEVWFSSPLKKVVSLEGHASSWPQFPDESDATAPRDSRGRERAQRQPCDERILARAPPFFNGLLGVYFSRRIRTSMPFSPASSRANSAGSVSP